MNKLFNLCVELLRVAASYIGMTYQEINIWLFVIIMPAMILILFILLIWKASSNRFYKKEAKTWERNSKHWESQCQYYKKLINSTYGKGELT